MQPCFWENHRVFPAEPVEPTVIKLSTVDHVVSRCYLAVLLFFPQPSPNVSPREIHSHLSKGMSSMLNALPIFLGDMEYEDEARDKLQVVIKANASIDFQLRDCSNLLPSYDELMAKNAPVSRLHGRYSCLAHPIPVCGAKSPMSFGRLVVVRGGLILCHFHSHATSDAVIPEQLFGLWAKYTAEATKGGSRPKPAIPFRKEAWDRSRMSEGVQGPLPSNFAIIPGLRRQGSSADAGVTHVRPKSTALFHVPAETLRRLHQYTVQGHGRSKAPFSRGDALVALLWQRYTLARQGTRYRYIAGQSDPTILFVGDIRTMMRPRLPPDYLGAAVSPFRTSAPLEQIIHGDDRENLADLAKRTRAAIEAFDEQGFKHMICAANEAQTITSVVPQPADLFFTNQASLRFRSVNWGPRLGVAETVREPYAGRDLPSGECLIMPRCPDGSWEVFMTCEVEIMELLVADELLKSFLRLECRMDGEGEYIESDSRARL